MNPKRRLYASLAALCLLAVVAVPVWLTWRTVRQQQRDQALIEAVQYRQVEKVRVLLDEGADANSHYRSDRAITIKEAVRDLLRLPHKGENRAGLWRDSTALALAFGAGKANTEIAIALLRKGADPNAMVFPEFGWRLLHWAVLTCSPELIQALLQAGAKADAKDKTGATPLMLITPKPTKLSDGTEVIVTGSIVTKPFSDVPATHWAYEAVPEPGSRARRQEPQQTEAQKRAIIRILRQAAAQHLSSDGADSPGRPRR
jgi:ankyrin repeat protein